MEKNRDKMLAKYCSKFPVQYLFESGGLIERSTQSIVGIEGITETSEYRGNTRILLFRL